MTALIDYTSRNNKKKRKTTLTNEVKQVIQALIATLGIMILALGIASFSITNTNTQKGYELEQAQEKHTELTNINEKLQTKITTSVSFKEIENTSQISSMTKAENLDYINREDNKI